MFTEGQLVNGRYLVQGETAQGDMGPAYRALDVEAGGLCVLRPIALVPEETQSLRQEIERINTLDHPNIVPPGELEMTEQQQPFQAGEFVEGSSLEELIRNEAPLAIPRACSLARQMAMALEAAHHAGVVHGDLKPSSVLVVREDDKEIARVCGFGIYPLKKGRFISLAHLVVSEDGQPLFGAAEYISPEQAVGASAEVLDGRTDIYSLGVILYQMLSGNLPHQGANSMEVLLSQIFAEPLAFPVLPGREIPVAVESLVLRTLAKKRGDRPASATALVDQLAAWEEREGPVRSHASVPAASAEVAQVPVAESPSVPPDPQPSLHGVISPGAEPVIEPAILPVSGTQEPQAFEMYLSGTPASSSEPARSAAGSFVPDIMPVTGPELVSEPRSQPPRILEFPQAEATAPSRELGSPADRAFVPDIEPEEEPPVIGTPGAPHASADQTSQSAGRATQQIAASSGGLNVHLGAPEFPKPSTAAAGDFHGASAVQAKPMRAAASGPVLFANFHPRQRKPMRKWSKLLGIAAIVILVLVGAGCGWLYYTGRTYWFNPDYVKMRVSSFLDYGTAGHSPQVETDAYSQSKVPSAPSNSGHAPTQTLPAKLPADGTKATTLSSSSGLPFPAPARLPAAVPPPATQPANSAADSANPEHPSGAQEAATTLKKQVTHANHEFESPAGLVAAAMTRGDYYFNLGDYDAAIRAYEDGLAHSPSNPQLLGEIARAKQAKAAEAKYLQ